MTARLYLDWNATAPLRPEARAAMEAALDLVGNPSSAHAEGRAARAAVERARAQVAALAGCAPDRVIFTSGATEAAALAARALPPLVCAEVEHDCVAAQADARLPVDSEGIVDAAAAGDAALALQAANSETGVLQPDPGRVVDLCDATQAVGRTGWRYLPQRARFAILAAHKLGGPKGAGALIAPEGCAPEPALRGGGQERGWRAGTENVAAIAGFGAAAEAAAAERAAGVWEAVAALRDRLEAGMRDAAPEAVVVGAGAARLPNTLCVALPGWAAETQVMALDLGGAAVSAGSACSSGKVRQSRTLRAMGYGAEVASCAIRVSLGLATTRAEVDRFRALWGGMVRKRRACAA